jgi:hypothetical protein
MCSNIPAVAADDSYSESYSKDNKPLAAIISHKSSLRSVTGVNRSQLYGMQATVEAIHC